MTFGELLKIKLDYGMEGKKNMEDRKKIYNENI